jgi:hypothetical protein
MADKNYPKITFGMIVLNGEPFLRYNLRALYPFAHQIIVVEGACPSAKDIATTDGHSMDATRDILRQFKKEEDPEDKLVIVTAEEEGYPNGFWSEKDEMSQAYARRATGNYLWQVDIDEFYLEKDMEKIISILIKGVDMISFPQISFWGAIDYVVDGFWLIAHRHSNYERIFAWGEGYRYLKHRPPTVIDASGKDLRLRRYVNVKQMKCYEIFLYHYSLLFPKQVEEKVSYYSAVNWTNVQKKAVYWFNNCYLVLRHPFHMHNVYPYLSWIKRYEGKHPAQIYKMMQDISNGAVNVSLRQNEDVECLLRNPFYITLSWMLEKWAYFLAAPLINKIYYYSRAFFQKLSKFFKK